MLDSAGRSAVPTSVLLKAFFALIFCILCLNAEFRWARGANARGEPKEDRGKVRKLTFPLSPLGSPLALPFPDSLTPLGRKPLDWRKLLGGHCCLICAVPMSRDLNERTISRILHAELRASISGERGSGRREREGGNLRREGNASAASFLSFLGFLPSHLRPAPSIKIYLTKG